MLKSLAVYFRKWLPKKSGEITITLDKESTELFKRLGTKIPTLNDRELIASSLICLEQKSNRIIKKMVTKKILALRKEKYDCRQIAEYLNSNGTPTITHKSKWESADIQEMIDKMEKGNHIILRSEK